MLEKLSSHSFNLTVSFLGYIQEGFIIYWYIPECHRENQILLMMMMMMMMTKAKISSNSHRLDGGDVVTTNDAHQNPAEQKVEKAATSSAAVYFFVKTCCTYKFDESLKKTALSVSETRKSIDRGKVEKDQ